jgi:hypothetical protein
VLVEEERSTYMADIDSDSEEARSGRYRSAADDRRSLEQPCCHITRPALANERVQTNAAGQVVLKLKTAWRDGTTHLIMTSMEFMQGVAALASNSSSMLQTGPT